MKTLQKVTLAVIITIAIFSFAACDNGSGTSRPTPTPTPTPTPSPGGNQTPVATDYTFGNLSQTAGSVTAVTITAKSGKSSGAVGNIRYAGNTAIPQTAGTYAVTFDVAAATGWNAVTGLSAGNLAVDTLVEMVQIQGGTFTMGSPAGEPDRSDNETQHSITLTGFKMGKYPVTQEQYEAVMGNNPSAHNSDGTRASYVTGLNTGNFPVEQVTWYDAVEFCNKLSTQEGLTPVYTITGRTPATGYPITAATVTADWSKNGYRLPTEAQWEYACRAGTGTPFNTGNNITTDQANYNGNYPYNGSPEGAYLERTTGVGSYAANTWGLYDMHGNVWEWCWDWYNEYSSGAQTDPKGAVSGSHRVQRGGSWYDSGRDMRSAFRDYSSPGIRDFDFGFRLVCP